MSNYNEYFEGREHPAWTQLIELLNRNYEEAASNIAENVRTMFNANFSVIAEEAIRRAIRLEVNSAVAKVLEENSIAERIESIIVKKLEGLT